MILKYDPNVVPPGLTLKELQNKMFNEKNLMENHDPTLYNNLSKLWYIYCSTVYLYPIDEKEIVKIIDKLNKMFKTNKPAQKLIIKYNNQLYTENKNNNQLYTENKNNNQLYTDKLTLQQNNNMVGGAFLDRNMLMMGDLPRDQNSTHFLHVSNIRIHSLQWSNWFCMSIPPNDRLGCFRKLSLLALHYDIKNIICLHVHDSNRNRDIADLEIASCRILNYLQPGNDQLTFIELEIPDMTAGNIHIYNQFFDLVQDNININTCIHCLAGFGRTGSMVLMYLLMISQSNGYYDLSVYHDINYYRTLVFRSVDHQGQVNELFANDCEFTANLLIGRLNLINLILATRITAQGSVCLYPLTYDSLGYNNNNLTDYVVVPYQTPITQQGFDALVPRFLTTAHT